MTWHLRPDPFQVWYEQLGVAEVLLVDIRHKGRRQRVGVRPADGEAAQKASGCFRTAAGAERFCRIRSYLSGAWKRKRPLLTVLEMAFEGRPQALTQ